MRPIYFISGLPRSGSTLLCNVLAQNPRFAVTSTSGLIDLLFALRTQWHALPETQRRSTEQLAAVMRGAVEGFFALDDRPVWFDKSRGWTSEIELLEAIIGRPVKILVPVRDIRDVLASFEKLYRRNFWRDRTKNPADYLQCQTVEGRCHYWLRQDQPLGIAYGRIVDAMHRGFRDRMHFVHYERFTTKPKEELEAIYSFLGEQNFIHDVTHVEQVTHDNDDAYGWGDLHTIRQKIEPQESQWPKVLGKFAENFSGLNFNG